MPPPPKVFFSAWEAPLDAARRALWSLAAAAAAGAVAASRGPELRSLLPKLSPSLSSLSTSESSAASPSSLAVALLAALLAFLLAAWRLGALSFSPTRGEPAVFMRDFVVWKPLESWKMSTRELVRQMRLSGLFSDESSVDFIEKVMTSAGFEPGQRLALSPGILKMRTAEGGEGGRRAPPEQPNHDDAVSESEAIIHSLVDDLLLKNPGVSPSDVDAVVTTCSCFAPVPSLAASVVNRFGMRADVLTASLAGAGCGGNVVAVDLAARVLRSLPRTAKGRFAIVVAHENVTNNWYTGNDKSMLLCNAIFRAGGAAALLTTSGDPSRNKYRLVATERTHLGRDDDAYRCMGQSFDPSSKSVGVFLRKNVGEVAARAVRMNLERLGPRVLPLSELARVAASRAASSLSSALSLSPTPSESRKLYEPNFESSFAQVYPHAGGPAVLDAMQKSLRLSDEKMRASRATWKRFGNLSAASTFYEMAFEESKDSRPPSTSRPPTPPRGVKRGDRSLVIGLGGCFKCGTIVWEAVRDISEAHEAWNDDEGEEVEEEREDAPATVAAAA